MMPLPAPTVTEPGHSSMLVFPGVDSPAYANRIEVMLLSETLAKSRVLHSLYSFPCPNDQPPNQTKH